MCSILFDSLGTGRTDVNLKNDDEGYIIVTKFLLYLCYRLLSHLNPCSVQFSSVQFNNLFGIKLFPKKYNSNTHIQTPKIKSTNTKDLNTITGQWHNKAV